MAKLRKFGDFVGPGERETAEHLRTQLPPHWVVIANKELVSSNATTRELDFIVVGSHAVFTIEEKSWRGKIVGNENGWNLDNGESYPSPLATVERAARRLKGFLLDRVPRLSEALSKQHFVHGRVVLSCPDARPFINDPRRDHVQSLATVVEHLREADSLQSTDASIEPFRDAIVEVLTRLPSRPAVPKKLGAYRTLAQLSATEWFRYLEAEHELGGRRILKVVIRPTQADAEAVVRLEKALLREYEALEKVAGTGRAPAVDPPLAWDQDLYWVIPIHPIQGQTLRSNRATAQPDPELVWQVVADAFTALSEVHAAGVVHRSITPDRVWIGEDGRVTFSDFAVARIAGAETIAEDVDRLDPVNLYRAPECLVDPGSAVEASDVYSLAASLHYWITGDERSSPQEPFTDLEMARSDLDPHLAETLGMHLMPCLAEDKRTRPSAATTAEGVSTAREWRDQQRREQEDPHEWQPGEIIDSRYSVVRLLGRGGTALTYLVQDKAFDNELFVLKRIRNLEIAARLAKTEFRLLKDLKHEGLPQAHFVQPPEHEYHLVLEYVRGSSLRELARDLQGNEGACLRVARDVLATLSYLHGRNLIHRDISPGNIMIPDEESKPVKLIDFGLATNQPLGQSAVGTPRYRAPEIDSGGQWSPLCDLYSLAVVLFELLTGCLPYRLDEGIPRKLDPLSSEDPAVAAHGRLARVLLKACAPDPNDRFQSAEAFRKAIMNAAARDEGTEVGGVPRSNPTVSNLRRAYRNTLIGNADNRGLDSEFTRLTYVNTLLDTALLPRIVSGDLRLVVLCGNPGDGKTAFLQKLREHLDRKGATIVESDESGWLLDFSGRQFAAVYDASESFRGQGADERLTKALEPVVASDSAGYCLLVAINDGRLIDYFERHETQFQEIWTLLRSQLDGASGPEDGIALIDLKTRSLVAAEPDRTSLFVGILSEFADSSRWSACEDCAARCQCPIRYNVISVSDPDLGPTVRRRLSALMQVVHLRREHRPTLRDLRSALAYVLTGDLDCADIHRLRETDLNPLAIERYRYYNLIFDRRQQPDLLLDEWAALDPALVPLPPLDRHLYFHRAEAGAASVQGLFVSAASRPDAIVPADIVELDRWMDTIKRRYYFEGKPPSPELLDCGTLFDPLLLLPYRYYRRFLDTVTGSADLQQVLNELLLGLSRADGAPRSACGKGLVLSVAEGSTPDLSVLKLYPSEEFALEPQVTPGEFTESLPDMLTIRHKVSGAKLRVGLDLFEYILRSADGYVGGALEQQALVEDLTVFKNSLLLSPTHEVVLVEAGRTTHPVVFRDGVIQRGTID